MKRQRRVGVHQPAPLLFLCSPAFVKDLVLRFFYCVFFTNVCQDSLFSLCEVCVYVSVSVCECLCVRARLCVFGRKNPHLKQRGLESQKGLCCTQHKGPLSFKQETSVLSPTIPIENFSPFSFGRSSLLGPSTIAIRRAHQVHAHHNIHRALFVAKLVQFV